MDGFGWSAAGVAVALCLVPGVAAASTGWVIPWLRGQVLRPRLWGVGEIALSVFFAWEAVFRTIVFPHGGGDTAFLLGLPFAVLGFALIALGQRPGRPRSIASD